MKRIKLLVRKNLKMSEGKVAAQCVHAVLALNCIHYLHTDELLLARQSVVVLMVSDAKFEEAKKEKMAIETESFSLIKDAGYTEVAPGTETVMTFLEADPRCLTSPGINTPLE